MIYESTQISDDGVVNGKWYYLGYEDYGGSWKLGISQPIIVPTSTTGTNTSIKK